MAKTAVAQTALSATKIASNIQIISGTGSNALLFVGADGCLMVDSGNQERSAEMVKVVAQLSGGKPVRTLFNTHWHPESTGGNDALAQAGAKILAHENTRLWMTTDVDCVWQKRVYQPRPKIAWPTETFFTGPESLTGKMMFEDEPVQWGYLGQAHTDGDIYVYLPKSNVLVTGDVMTPGRYPIPDYSSGGWIGALSRAPKMLLDVANADTKIVPGDGPVQTRADLEEHSKMITTVYDRLAELMRTGMGHSDMKASAVTKEFDAKWGSPKVLLDCVYRGLWGHARELGKIV